MSEIRIPIAHSYEGGCHFPAVYPHTLNIPAAEWTCPECGCTYIAAVDPDGEYADCYWEVVASALR